jgi:hypothetical protein
MKYAPKYGVQQLILMLLLTCGLVGCQSTNARPAEDRASMPGKMTFIEVPTGQGPRQVIAYVEPVQPICPTCQRPAADYFPKS